MTKVISLKLSDEHLRKLEVLKDLENDSMSAIIRRAIDYYYVWRVHIEPKKVMRKYA